MDRRTFQRGLVALGVAGGAGLALGPNAASAAPASSGPGRPGRPGPRTLGALRSRSLREYALPEAGQTHEPVKVPGAPLLLITQWYPSRLLHRLLVTRRSVFATEMHSSTLAQLEVPLGHR
ncbi:hypothetical protein [Streptomyces sp. DG1A-41]|uniref:hypothetical protein n=1 Tax=Streptomyces sp. DG1A-41 TaxID=3125779 RepID=UPI0030CC0599